MKFLTLVLMFFILSSLLIISNNEIYLSTDEGIKEFSEIYVSWISQFLSNLLNLSGDVVKQNWLP